MHALKARVEAQKRDYDSLAARETSSQSQLSTAQQNLRTEQNTLRTFESQLSELKNKSASLLEILKVKIDPAPIVPPPEFHQFDAQQDKVVVGVVQDQTEGEL